MVLYAALSEPYSGYSSSGTSVVSNAAYIICLASGDQYVATRDEITSSEKEESFDGQWT